MSLASPIARRAFGSVNRIARPPSRSLFGFPSPFGSSSSTSPSNPTSNARGTLFKRGSLFVYEETREMKYTPEQLYSVIADVDAYKSFLPFTTESRILSATVASPSSGKKKQVRPIEAKGWLRGGEPGELWDLEGQLQIGAMGYQESYVSRVQAKKWESVSATANDSNIFKHLETKWTLVPLAGGGAPRTRVELYLAYSFISPFHAAAVSAVWEKVSGLMVDGFEKRVTSVYG